MKKKKFFFLITIIFFLIILICFFYINMSKKSKIAHTNTSQEIIKNILNISSYKAIVEVKVISNKNENKYVIKQEYKSQDKNSQEILEPINIKGTKIIKDENKLTLENTQLNLSNIIENYQYISENNLDLKCFVEDYKSDNNSECEETENEIIMHTNYNINNKETKSNNNLYKKRLYIDKKTGLPTKLEMDKDKQKNKVYILYNEVEIK